MCKVSELSENEKERFGLENISKMEEASNEEAVKKVGYAIFYLSVKDLQSIAYIGRQYKKMKEKLGQN